MMKGLKREDGHAGEYSRVIYDPDLKLEPGDRLHGIPESEYRRIMDKQVPVYALRDRVNQRSQAPQSPDMRILVAVPFDISGDDGENYNLEEKHFINNGVLIETMVINDYLQAASFAERYRTSSPTGRCDGMPYTAVIMLTREPLKVSAAECADRINIVKGIDDHIIGLTEEQNFVHNPIEAARQIHGYAPVMLVTPQTFSLRRFIDRTLTETLICGKKD